MIIYKQFVTVSRRLAHLVILMPNVSQK